MKCLILAAGYATRLYPLTENFPKPLLEVADKPILDWLIDDMAQTGKIDEYIVISNHKFAHIFEDWRNERLQAPLTSHCSQRVSAGLSESGASPASSMVSGDSPASSMVSGGSPASISVPSGLAARKPITIIDDGTETNDTRLGAVCDLLFAMDKLCIKDDMLVVAADNLLFFSFNEFVKFAKEKGTSCIMCHEQRSIEKLQRTGVVELDASNRVLGMEEKPEVPKSHWAVPPFYIYLKKDLPLVRHSVANGCGKDAPGNLAHYMVEHTTMHAWPMSAGRFDIGSLDTYYQACELAREGKI